ncbi:hypothetical protein BJY04DRAFT_75699 [Aspergillus karnatakaensis]|uniref:uncharacterized protein n=1 Tax=Aspergillus karnatakaensis TaxID=1810916 RepID=UPI003CCD87C6
MKPHRRQKPSWCEKIGHPIGRWIGDRRYTDRPWIRKPLLIAEDCHPMPTRLQRPSPLLSLLVLTSVLLDPPCSLASYLPSDTSSAARNSEVAPPRPLEAGRKNRARRDQFLITS